MQQRVDVFQDVLFSLESHELNFGFRNPLELRTELLEHRVVSVDLILQALQVRDRGVPELSFDVLDAARHVYDVRVLERTTLEETRPLVHGGVQAAEHFGGSLIPEQRRERDELRIRGRISRICECRFQIDRVDHGLKRITLCLDLVPIGLEPRHVGDLGVRFGLEADDLLNFAEPCQDFFGLAKLNRQGVDLVFEEGHRACRFRFAHKSAIRDVARGQSVRYLMHQLGIGRLIPDRDDRGFAVGTADYEGVPQVLNGQLERFNVDDDLLVLTRGVTQSKRRPGYGRCGAD